MRVSKGCAVSACMVGLSGVRMVRRFRCSHRWKVSSTLGGTTRIANAVSQETRYQNESPRKWRSPTEVRASWSPGRWVSTSVAVAANIWSRVAVPCWPKGVVGNPHVCSSPDWLGISRTWLMGSSWPMRTREACEHGSCSRCRDPIRGSSFVLMAGESPWVSTRQWHQEAYTCRNQEGCRRTSRVSSIPLKGAHRWTKVYHWSAHSP